MIDKPNILQRKKIKKKINQQSRRKNKKRLNLLDSFNYFDSLNPQTM